MLLKEVSYANKGRIFFQKYSEKLFCEIWLQFKMVVLHFNV